MRASKALVGALLCLGLVGAGWAAPPPVATAPTATPAPAAPTEGTDQPGADWAKQAAEMEDIHDIRPPVVVGWDPRWRWVAAGTALALGLGAALWVWRRRAPGGRETAASPPKPPHEVALEALTGLESALAGDTKGFYFGLTAVVRDYLDDRFGVDTREKTTEEVLPVVRGLPLDADRRRDLADLFRFADPVKYADAPAEPSVRGAHLAAARSLVESTRPRPEDPGA